MKLIMCQGLPASGKSTWAAGESAKTGAVVVNKDDIRAALKKTGWVWSEENEKQVEAIRDSQIESALFLGNDVISSDTNFARKHKVRLEQLARKFRAKLEIQRFDVPLEECVERDAKREGDLLVGREVIETMYHKYVAGDPAKFPLSAKALPELRRVERDERLMPALVSDLDGTLALFEAKGHRGPYDASRADEDECNLTVKRVLETFYREKQYQIIYLTGREEIYRSQTKAFLGKHNCPPGPLYMRKAGDHRKDWIVKAELFDQHVRGKYNVDFVLDDRNQVVDMWRKLGLICFQVAPGDF